MRNVYAFEECTFHDDGVGDGLGDLFEHGSIRITLGKDNE